MTDKTDPRIKRRDALLAIVRQEYESLVSAQQEAQKGAVHEDNRQEGDKDMRATEASYLARGQAQRVTQLGDELRRIAAWNPQHPYSVTSVSMMSLVTLENEDELERTLLMAPGGAGTTFSVDGEQVNVITVTSPLGRALIGAAVDDDVEVRIAGNSRVFAVVRIR